MKLLFLTAAAIAMAADGPRVVYSKVFPGSSPPYVWIAVERSGAAAFKSAEDEDADAFHIEEAAAKEIFDLAGKLDHFNHPLESGLKVANMGAKVFRWEDGAAASEAKFNYSTDESAKALQDWFDRITDSQILLAQLQRTAKHDKLGVMDVMLNLQASWDNKRLVGAAQFLPMLDLVAKNEVFLHMARERAAKLAEAIRAANKG